MMHAVLILSEGTLGLLAVLASILAIVFILVSKGYKKFVHCLTLYLIVAVQFDGVVSILQAVLIHHNGTIVATMQELRGQCAAAGFFNQCYGLDDTVNHLLDSFLFCDGVSV